MAELVSKGEGIMTEVVIALYKPREGKEQDLEKLIQKHVPVLRGLGLITSRPRLTLKSSDGTYMEIIEWIDVSAAERAHEHPAVAQVWESMETVSSFQKLKDLPEATKGFSHFKVVPHLSEMFS
jgi:hypothetical protein